MPDDFIIKVNPAFRAGQRFVMPLMSGLAVVAGIGAAMVLGCLPMAARWPGGLALAVVLALDLFVRFPHAPATVPVSPALHVLATLPRGPVMAYADPVQIDCLQQPQHGDVLLNTCGINGDPAQAYFVPLIHKCATSWPLFAPWVCATWWSTSRLDAPTWDGAWGRLRSPAPTWSPRMTVSPSTRSADWNPTHPAGRDRRRRHQRDAAAGPAAHPPPPGI